MKKSIIGLMGLFTLMACSEDAIQDAEDQGLQMSTNSFNPQDPGFYIPGAGFPPNHAGINYFSPWDIWYRGTGTVVPTYTYTNMEGDASSPFVIVITPYVGLAYYDDTNDGLYHDPAQGNALIADLTNGNFPNLYKNGNEIGNVVRGENIILDGTSTVQNEVSIGSTIDHCPVVQGNVNTGWNPAHRYLNIDNTTTPQEKNLLAQYGKVHFYEVKVIERATGNTLVPNLPLQAQVSTFGDPYASWQPTGVTINLFGSLNNLMYYKDLVNGPGTNYTPNLPPSSPGTPPVTVCDSREVVFDNQFPDAYIFWLGTVKYEVRIIMGQGTGLWMASGHHIGIRAI